MTDDTTNGPVDTDKQQTDAGASDAQPKPVLSILQGGQAPLTNAEQDFIKQLAASIDADEYFPALVTENNTLLSIAKKNPRLLENILADAKARSENEIQNDDGEDVKELHPDVYDELKRHIHAALDIAEAQAVDQPAPKTPVQLSDREQELLDTLQQQMDDNENSAATLVGNHDLLLKIARKNPSVLDGMVKDAKSRAGNFWSEFSHENANTLKKHIDSILEDTGYYKIGDDAPAATDDNTPTTTHVSKPSGKFKAFMMGVLTTLAGTGVGARVLQEYPDAQDKVSWATKHVGVPLSPKDQATAILANPDALYHLAEQLNTGEGYMALRGALETGDPNYKAEALLKLSKVMAATLNDVGASQEKAAPKLRNLGR